MSASDGATWSMAAARVGGSLAFAGLVAYRGLRKRSLNVQGASAAIVVASASMASLPRSGISLLAFYLSGSKLTKVAAEKKALLDDEYREGGQRGAGQVLACSLFATLLAVGHFCKFGFWDGPWDQGGILHSAVLLGTAAHYATCAADTWASEVGVLNKSWPRLITRPWESVPPGTNGGVSALGLAASFLGGIFAGAVLMLSGPFCAGTSFGQEWLLVPISGAFGLLGSLVDSLLGATLQESRYDEDRKCITLQKTGKLICGRDILDNQQVNVVSVLLVTALGFAIPYIL
ncbi:Transmembrane protein 19 [Hondaea fermentalgiana]|uniref:Transmembrane protein 19 n=1 Tax=Hondaea fermentalgiana TaxID=2315210 RepID=A0A2R5GK42_9STRA|nr:Transmembrane protein 19 [Hondaea fermentalgiana]|eukprot:GBG28234.1 Transmembrane protein 19 [Hondaea fermentalgiana]